jgi:hypothetical protein
MKKIISTLAALLSISMSTWADDNQTITPLGYPALYILQWTYNCSQQMQPQFEYQGMPQPLALQFSIQQCSCVIDEFRKHYRYEETISMDFNSRAAAATKMAESCLVGVNTDKQI